MALNDPVVFDEQSVLRLQQQLDQLRADYRSITAQLKRHQAEVQIPPRRIRFINNNSGTAPAWGVLRITGATAKQYLTIDQPDSTYRWLYLVNGGSDVPTGKPGWGTYLTSDYFRFADNYVLYDTGATPAYGDEWGPTASSWKLTKYHPGFLIMGGNNTESGKERTVAIQRSPSEVLIKNGTGSDIAASHTGDTYKVYGGPAASETDSGMTLTCMNRSSVSFKNGKYGAAAFLGGENYAVPFET